MSNPNGNGALTEEEILKTMADDLEGLTKKARTRILKRRKGLLQKARALAAERTEGEEVDDS